MTKTELDIHTDTMANKIARESLISQYFPEWEDYPFIGEHDWERIIDKVYDLIPPVSAQDAYRFFQERARNDAS